MAKLQHLARFKKVSESETASTMTDYPEALFSNTDTVGIFNESDADTNFDFTILMPINAGGCIDKHYAAVNKMVRNCQKIICNEPYL